jgi:hypothetical protein
MTSELIGQALADLAVVAAVETADALAAELFQVAVGRASVGNVEVREVVPLETEVEVHISAMRIVLESASGISPKTRAISSGPLK